MDFADLRLTTVGSIDISTHKKEYILLDYLSYQTTILTMCRLPYQWHYNNYAM